MEDTRPENKSQISDDIEATAETDSGQSVESLSARLAEAEQTVAELKDSMLRERANLENQRRRLHRDVEQARRFANENILRDLLTVCDNLEHGLAAETDNASSLREGMELTLKSLNKVTNDHGLTQVDPVGKPFDPEWHQAMSTVVTEEQAPDTVVSVMQKGYVLNERLLRPALVMVAKAPE